MKMIKPSFEILDPQGYDFISMCKQIELCGRTCYKSEDKITDNSAEPFVKRMVDSSHFAMLEHATVYLKVTNIIVPEDSSNPIHYVGWDLYNKFRSKYTTNKHSHCIEEYTETLYITTNYRVIVENGWEDDLKYMCEPSELHVKRISVKFVCNRQVSHEFVRHRTFSFAQSSTRFCNYSKDKFGHELTFIEPCWLEDEMANEWSKTVLIDKLKKAEIGYLELLKEGWKPQHAATLLPNALKTELIMTGFVDADGWLHFFDLRALGTTGAPHPQAKELALPLMEEFKKRGYIQ